MASADFEEMSCALLDKEPGVRRAELFATPFRRQYGIDAFGEVEGGQIVISCKCYGTITKGQIAQWSTEFLDHWDSYWKHQSVVAFKLVVAAPTNSPERLADIETEIARFKELGLEYEVWSPRQLQEKLRDQDGIVSQYLGPEWVERLCGRGGRIVIARASSDTVLSDLEERFASIRETLSGEVELRIEAAAKQLEDGRADEVDETLTNLRESQAWNVLNDRVKARVLRLQGSVRLHHADIDGAAALSAEADRLAAPEEPRLQALIAMHREGPRAGLAVLGMPLTHRGHILRAGLLLNMGDLDSAETAISALPSDDLETRRLKAYLALFRGRADLAWQHVVSAEAISGEGIAVARVSAMVRYALALSPHVTPEAMYQPQPIARPFVRRDDQSQRHLEEAAAMFDRLATLAGGFAAADSVWALACIANLDGRANEAERRAQALLAADPTNALVIAWGLARGLDIDREASLTALLAQLHTGGLDANGPRALDWLTDPTDTSALLEASTRALANQTWPSDVEFELRKLTSRLEERLAGTKPPDSDILSVLDWATRTGDWATLEAVVPTLVVARPVSPLLLGVAETLASVGRWQPLVAAVPAILSFETADTARFAAMIAIHGDQPAEAVRILTESVGAFPRGRLPYELRRLETQALVRSGDAAAALKRATLLAGETGAIPDRLLEAQIRVGMGDARGAAPALRAALADAQLAPSEALTWSHRLVSDEPELARELLRHAVAAGLDDQSSLAALMLAFRLGVEHENPALFGAIQRIATSNPATVRSISVDEVIAEMRRAHERANALEEQWQRGEVATHVVLDQLRGNLADLFHFTDHAIPRRGPLFIRNGARGLDLNLGEPLKSWRLHLDVTALLIADRLDLLALVEERDQPIMIGPSLVGALYDIEERCRHNQPSRIRAAQAIVAAVGCGVTIGVREDAIRVVHNIAPGDHDGRKCNLTAVVQGLLAAAWIDDATADLALRHLNLSVVEGEIPVTGTILLFESQTLDLLADANLLKAACSAFSVYVAPDVLQVSQNEIKAAAHGDGQASWIARLRQRIRDGLESGRYRLLPATKRAEDEQSASALLRSLFEILRGAKSKKDKIWVDDRYVSGFPWADRAPVIGVLEVLDALRREGRVDDASYYDRLRRLREGGALFVPFAIDEIFYHLMRASVSDDELIETPALGAIRRNLALALYFEPKLKIGEAVGLLADRPDELQFLMTARHLAEALIVRVWNAEADPARAAARSTWAWFALRAENLRRGTQVKHPLDPRVGIALNIASLVAGAIQLGPVSAMPTYRRRAAFFSWVERTVSGDRFTTDPDLGREVGKLTASLFKGALEQGISKRHAGEVRALVLRLLRGIVAQMPKALLDVTLSDTALRSRLGFDTPRLIVQAQGHDFPADRFWKAIYVALNYGRARVRTANRRKIATLTRDPKVWTTLRFGGVMKGEFVDAAIGALDRNRERRRAALDSLLATIDIPAGMRGEVAARLEALRQPIERVHAIEQLRSESVTVFLSNLSVAIGRGTELAADQFYPPPAKSWLAHVRWQDSNDLTAAAELLTDELGAEVAFLRLAALPVLLPEHLYRVFQEPGALERAHNHVRTPIQRLHLLRVCVAISDGDKSVDLGAAVDAFLDFYGPTAVLFVALLRWAANAFERQPIWQGLTAAEKHVVVWTYADCITDMLAAVGARLEDLSEFFSTNMPQRPTEAFVKLEHGYDDSALHPIWVSSESLLVYGLEYALGSKVAEIIATGPRQERLLQYLTVMGGDGNRHLRPLRDFSSASNPFPTWLSRTFGDPAMPCYPAIGANVVLELLDQLDSNPNDLKHWFALVAFGPLVFPADTKARLTAIVTRLEFERVASVGDDSNRLIVVADFLARQDMPEASLIFLDRLYGFAYEQFKGGYSEGSQARLHALLEVAASAAKMYEPGDALARLGKFLSRVSSIHPDLTKILRPIFNKLVDSVPATRSEGLWSAVLSARMN
jgi:hypothetical protein